VDVVPVTPGRDLGRFIRLPFRLYRDDPRWVAPIPSDERARLTPGRNPYFEHARAEYFLARSDGRDVGRIAASVDENYDRAHQERQATFGFFEAESAEAARALLSRAEEWARANGAQVLRGPMSFTTNDEVGLLLQGFESRPALLMPYNPPSYRGWIEASGFAKAKDLYAFRIGVMPHTPEPYARVADKVRKRYSATVRPVDLSRFAEELGRVKEIYNAAWQENWGFVPMTDHEIDHMAKQLKPALNPKLLIFVEVEGKPIAFALVLPDVNVALRPIRGRLFPFGLLRLLWTLPRIREGRLMALGIRSEYRRRGVDALLMDALVAGANAAGLREVEIGWTLEDNHLVNRNIEQMTGVHSKTYRVFEKRL
jgi:GNAT superfamily N-acetyltransferase